MDANGILNVTAVENATGKTNHITIKNDKGRLTKEEIAKMVADAEKFKEQDEQIKAAVAGRNELEAYVYQMKNLVSFFSEIITPLQLINKMNNGFKHL